MREMKRSEIEWIRDIPANWKVMPNKYLMYKTKDICPVYGGEDILSLTMKGVIVRDLDAGGKMPASFDGYQRLEAGNLLMCLFDIDVTPRCIGLIKQSGLSSPAYSQFVLKECADAAYYCYYYTMLDNDKTLLHLAKNLRHSLTEEQLGAVPTVVPPIDEQKKIAAFLDVKCAEIDALIADVQAQIDVLEQYKRSVITETVTKGLNPDVEMKDSGYDWVGMMPSTWVMRKGKYMFVQRSLRGNSIELQLLSPTQKFGVIPQSLYEELTGMSAVKLSEKADLSLLKTIHKGDFCISLRSFQGGFEYSEYEGVVSPAYQVFYPTVEIADGYYRYLFKESGFIEKMNSYTMTLRDGKNIAFADFGNTYIPYPPVEEQVAIADFLDAKVAEIDGIIDQKKEQLEVLDSYKKSLIYEYVTGKKSVPLTEPAIEAVMIDPHVILAGMVIDLLGDKLKGKTQIQKLLYLFDSHLGLNLATQYYRYKHGPYDLSLDHYLNVLVENGWFKKVPGDAEKYEKGSNHAEFCDKYKDAFAQHSRKINSLVSFVKDMKRTSQIERIATIFAVWNDLILDGNRTPTDDEIIHEILTHWTPNKAKTTEDTWKGTLAKMRKQGIIPRGQGLHTLPMPQRGVNNA